MAPTSSLNRLRDGDPVDVYVKGNWELGEFLRKGEDRKGPWVEVALRDSDRPRKYDETDVRPHKPARRSGSGGRSSGSAGRRGRQKSDDDGWVVVSDSELDRPKRSARGRRSARPRLTAARNRRTLENKPPPSPRSQYVKRNNVDLFDNWSEGSVSYGRRRGNRTTPRRSKRVQFQRSRSSRTGRRNSTSPRSSKYEDTRSSNKTDRPDPYYNWDEPDLEDEILRLCKRLGRIDLVRIVDYIQDLPDGPNSEHPRRHERSRARGEGRRYG